MTSDKANRSSKYKLRPFSIVFMLLEHNRFIKMIIFMYTGLICKPYKWFLWKKSDYSAYMGLSLQTTHFHHRYKIISFNASLLRVSLLSKAYKIFKTHIKIQRFIYPKFQKKIRETFQSRFGHVWAMLDYSTVLKIFHHSFYLILTQLNT